MQHYSITECITRYGASDYLKAVRKRFCRGRYSREQFIYCAARAYLLIDKPFRALALLESLDSPIKSSEYNAKLLDLTSKIKSLPIVPSPTCSLNMIAKNESGNIAAALDSVDDVVDEIVVCDTGSIDTTPEIAALYGATVVSVPWRDDFSFARNSAIDASACSWIFWMDADDVLDPMSKGELINLWRSASPVAAAFRIACGQENAGYGEFLQVRLFPREKSIRFERRVHEQIMFSAARNNIPFMQFPSVRIIHTGYNNPLAQKAKARRNKPLILAELKDYPNDPALLLNYGDCFMVLEERENAYKAYMCIARNRTMYDTHPDVFIQAVFNIAGLHYSKKEYSSAIVWLMACLNLDGTRIEALFLLGLAHEALRDFPLAFDCFLAAARGNGALRQTATNTSKIKIQAIYHCAQILLSSRCYDEAEDLLTHAIKAFPNVVEYYTLLGQASIKQNKLKEAALAFMQSLSLSPEKNTDAYVGMALVYAQLHDLGKAREYLKMGNVETPG